MKRALILYASNTGNTEKVAHEFKKNFERLGLDPELKTLAKNCDAKNPDFDFNDYDFLCVGSPVIWGLPVPWLVDVFRNQEIPSRKIIPGPKCGVAFCTYGGAHLGPREAEAALKLLEILFEHLGYKSVGSIAIPGKHGNQPQAEWFHPDLIERPNEKDFQRIAAFVDEIFANPLMEYYRDKDKGRAEQKEEL